MSGFAGSDLLSGSARQELERVKGIEPSSSAWKAVALPLSYTRLNSIAFAGSHSLFRLRLGSAIRRAFRTVNGGGGWIRTNVGVANGFTVRPL